LRKDILNVRIAFHSLHVRSSRQRFRDLATPFHQNRIHNVERTMLDAALTQPLEDGPLCCPALIPQCIVHEAAFFTLGLQSLCRAQVGLVNKHDYELGLLPIGSVIDHPRRNLIHRDGATAMRAVWRVNDGRRTDHR
jgi:hypothetical protein